MGIDIYASWKGQSAREKKAQITGFSTVHGHVGYLREAYHGSPYATQYLVGEAFDSEDGTAKIPASVMRDRLPKVLEIVKERYAKIYPKDSAASVRAAQKSFSDFVRLCEEKEAKTGEPCEILASY